VKHALVTVFLLLLAFVGLTWWALESSGVAVLETRRPDGSTRSTHVWHVTHNGEVWLEAGTPENAWFQDVEGSPRVLLTRTIHEAPAKRTLRADLSSAAVRAPDAGAPIT
jgi:hypothetical protein